jgi:shikimate kinase
MLLVLVGLPGSGKTTVGRQLARRLHLPFVDSDHAIEHRLGCSIREYFEREGEDRFRDLESEVLDDLSLNHQGVLSSGGGSVLRPINRERLRERGHVFYLRSSPEVCATTRTVPCCKWPTHKRACAICLKNAIRCTVKQPITSSKLAALMWRVWST